MIRECFIKKWQIKSLLNRLNSSVRVRMFYYVKQTIGVLLLMVYLYSFCILQCLSVFL